MTMSDARFEEFITVWEQAYGERLTAGEARLIATRLIDFYRLIMRPLTSEPAPPIQSESGAA